ncbi:hypothetical protein [Roseateles sp.]|jgi:hypothetical protein|uniref:hypothetical protein n=1 Tax=Roseateles sp. TaxID=1971397 RepID=UPI00391DE204
MKPEHDSDQDLRHALRQAAPPGDSEALQARVLAQWQQRQQAGRAGTPLHAGQGQLTIASWREHPMRWWLPLALAASLLLLAWCSRPDPGVQELMQLDVLSQIAIGEL